MDTPAGTNPALDHLKDDLRRRARARRSAMPPEPRGILSSRACADLYHWLTNRGRAAVIGYAAAGTELDLAECLVRCLEHGRVVLMPRVDRTCPTHLSLWRINNLSDCREGYRGIREPDPELCHPAARGDLEGAVALVPGVAFDVHGRRLGQGGGHYDRLLAELAPARVVRVGICFDEQIVASVPAGPHDVTMEYLATPSGVLTARLDA